MGLVTETSPVPVSVSRRPDVLDPGQRVMASQVQASDLPVWGHTVSSARRRGHQRVGNGGEGMKFRAERGPLAEAVAWTARALPLRPTVPVLAGLMLRVHAGTLSISGFDYEVSNQATLNVNEDAEGAVLVSGRLLAEIVKALPAKPVEMAAVGSSLELVCGSGRFTLPTMPVEDYPTLPEMPEPVGRIDAKTFASAVSQVAAIAGRDETLPLMTGVLLEIDGETIALQATDRYRLAERELTWRPHDPEARMKALIPAKVLADIGKTIGAPGGEVTLFVARSGTGDGLIGFATDTRRTTCRLLDGEYPKVRSLFPDHHVAQARVSAPALTEVVKRVSLVAERSTAIRISFSEYGMVVEAGLDDARASEDMEAEYTGEPMQVSFAPQYLLDGLGVLEHSTAILSFTGPKRPALVVPVDDEGEIVLGFRYLMMPRNVT